MTTLVKFWAIPAMGLVLGALPAAAMTEFDFTGGSGSLASSYTDTVDGIGLTGTAKRFDIFGDIVDDALVGHYGDGLGVTTGLFDPHYVDGFLGNDLLVFTFDKEVKLTEVSFTHNDWTDNFSFFFDAGNGPEEVAGFIDVPGAGFASTYVFQGDWMGEVFGVGARGWEDEFKISGLGVEMAPIPLPAPVLMLAAACAGFGFAGYRRRRAEA